VVNHPALTPKQNVKPSIEVSKRDISREKPFSRTAPPSAAKREKKKGAALAAP
jgi:hypothetical protein